jgi:putative ABC transport system ATP-binding protein
VATQPATQPAPDAGAEPIITAEALSKVYDMGDVKVHALRGVSLSIARGELIAIMGTSGSGKSTMMNILGCLDKPTSGSYRLGGREVSKMTSSQLADVRNRTLGFVFQSFNLLTRTSALENVELPLIYTGVGGRERHQRAAEALTQVGLGKRLDHMPSQLSGGQQQRVAIARAIVGRPQVLLADEPTGNLDSRTSVEIMATLQELWRGGMTLVLVTHEPDIASYASRVIVMRDGRIQSDIRQSPVLAAEALAAMPLNDDPVEEVAS